MISIFTGVHAASNPYLIAAYNSILDQSHNQKFKEWEWVLVENNGGNVPDVIKKDMRCKVYGLAMDGPSVGKVKAHACAQCTGDILLELDGDDLLVEDCLDEVEKAFSDPSIQFVYSNTAEFNEDFKPQPEYGACYGWQYREFDWHGNKLREGIAWPPAYHSIRRLFWAPNHVRAWRKSAYLKIGGHNPNLKVADDHDILCRTYIQYGENGFKHIDKCLYLYRCHPLNTVKTANAELQKQSNLSYLRYIEDIALTWALDNKLACYDLGARINRSTKPHYTSVDLFGADWNFDLEKPWPILPKSAGVIRAYDCVEHISDQIHFYNEAYRVLAPGGLLQIEVPSVVGWDDKGNQTVGLGAFRDFSHKCYYSYQNFYYITKQRYARFLQPQLQARFQVSRVETWLREENCPVVTAELICLKPGYQERHAGEIEI